MANTDLTRELVEECLDRWEDSGVEVLEEVCARHPDCADQVRRRIRKLLDTGLLVASEGGQIPEQLGRYRILRRLGGGGMGVVFAARDEDDGREVALKVVRPEMLLFGAARKRFEREVAAVSRLDHPSLIEIYDVGEHDGLPYLAMELIDGSSVGEALIELSARDPATLEGSDLGAVIRPGTSSADGPKLFEGPWSRVAVRVCHEIAKALAHAHAHGVVHRDVKPSNVMITRDGRVKLLDFGLARADDQVAMTRSGVQLGSLPYMSPEQIRGERQVVGPRSDVYALGVTLFEILSLHLPFASHSEESLRREILAGAPRITKVQPNVDADIATVLECALDPDPRRRYASASEFAEDLGRILAGRPIVAQPVSLWRRAERAARRRPVAATAALALGVSAIVIPTLLLLQRQDSQTRIENAETRLAAAEKRSTQQGERGDKHLKAALVAVDELVTSVARRRPGVADCVSARKQLEQAIAICDQATKVDGESSLALYATGRAYRALGQVEMFSGDFDAAMKAFDQAQTRFDRFAKARPGTARPDYELGTLRLFRARIFRNREQWSEAKAQLLEALALFEQERARGGSTNALDYHAGRACLDLSMLAFHQGDFESAVARAKEAAPFFARMGQSNDLLDVHVRLAAAHERVALVRCIQGRYEEAEAAYAEGHKALEANPYSREAIARAQLAILRHGQGQLWARTGRMDEAQEALKQSIKAWAELASDENARIPEYAWQHARAQSNLAHFMAKTKKPKAAQRGYEAALALHRELPEHFAKLVKCRRSHIEVLLLYAQYSLEINDRRRARRLLKDADEATIAALELAPRDALLHSYKGQQLWLRAKLIARARRAETAIKAALSAHREAYALGARVMPTARVGYGETLIGYASLLISTKRLDQALGLLNEAVDRCGAPRYRITRYTQIDRASADPRIAEILKRAGSAWAPPKSPRSDPEAGDGR